MRAAGFILVVILMIM